MDYGRIKNPPVCMGAESVGVGLFSPSSGGWKSEIRVTAWSGSGDCLLAGLQVATSSLGSHVAFSGCMHMEKERSLSLPLLIRAPVPS